MLAFTLFPGDSVVALALLLLAFSALTGRMQGGVRMAVTLPGALLSLYAAVNFSSWAPVIHWPDHPLYERIWPPIIVFVSGMILVKLIAEAVHRPVYIHFKYKNKTDDTDFFRWEHLNHRTGVALGVIIGMVYLIALCTMVNVLGYASSQLKPQAEALLKEPAALKIINRLYHDLQSSGLAKATAPLDPAPDTFYETADLLGLVYHNYGASNLIHATRFERRLLNYPGLFTFFKLTNVQSLMNDTTFEQMVRSKTNFHRILEYPPVVSLLRSREVSRQFKKINTADLLDYLKNGYSEDYSPEGLKKRNVPFVIGRWELDEDSTFQTITAKYQQAGNAEVTTTSRNNLYAFILNMGYGLKLTFNDDNTVEMIGHYFIDETLYKSREKLGDGVVKKNVMSPKPPLMNWAFVHAKPARIVAKGTWERSETDVPTKINFTVRPAGRPVAEVFNVRIYEAAGRLLAEFGQLNKETYVFERSDN